VLIGKAYEALLRARRRHARWSEVDRRRYQRHRWRVEGIHGESKTQHGLRRAVRRHLWNIAIQAYLTAAVINLKRLAALLWLIFPLAWARKRHSEIISPVWTAPRIPVWENRAAFKRAA